MCVFEVVDVIDFIVFISKDDMFYYYKKERFYDK